MPQNHSESPKAKKKTPWPTRDAMAQIYEKNLWGGEENEFYSGDGSHLADLTDPYIARVRQFLQSFNKPPVVFDMGCGDFNVGRQLAPYARKYIAADIVKDLIERNRKEYDMQNIEFLCLDLAEDEWPTAGCVILRNVLQHLSNAEIQKITAKLPKYKYIILTEHLPEGNFTPNKDIISGQGIRLKRDSGVDLEAPPFNLKPAQTEEWLRLPYRDGKGLVVTKLLVNKGFSN